MFVLNMPQRIVGQPVALAPRVVGAVFAIAVYCLLWMLVRAVYRALRGLELAEKEFRMAA